MTDGSHLKTIEKRLLWLSHWMIHHANHVRPKVDGIKTGGHQASSASMVSIMTALYFSALRPQDRVAVKPHASPVFHAIQYLTGQQNREKLENFRGYGGAQSYPSRTRTSTTSIFRRGQSALASASRRYRNHRLEHFGQTGAIGDLYRYFRLDRHSIAASVMELTAGRRVLAQVM